MSSKLPAASWKDRLLWLFGRRIGFEVSGDSMLPALKTGDLVLVAPRQTFLAGDIVLANHPYKKGVRMIKRIASIDSDANYFLTGDNKPESTDSQTFGAIAAKDILGKVVSRLN
ncbi:MAG: nickel-type superoxide dismutase maturation protease [Acidobacteria bacterium]|nr:nickel-type superoxide dismutase maturation protease [Acidobacteriota bacterium]